MKQNLQTSAATDDSRRRIVDASWTHRRCSDTLGKAGEVLHLHFQIGGRVQEGLLQAEIQKEEEGALQVHFQVEVREGLRLSSPERLV